MNRDSESAGLARRPHNKAFAGKLPGLLLWAGGGFAIGICIVILLMWGMYGPNYLFDLIAAYCL
jgi:hypothetical protein